MHRTAADEATRGSAVKLFADTAGRVLGFVTGLLVARGLGPERFDDFAVLFGIAVLAAEASDFGLQGTASRALVAGTLDLRDVLGAKLRLTTGLLLALALTVPFAGGRLAPAFGGLVVYFVLTSWSEMLGVALRARGRPLREAAVIVTFRSCALALVVAAWLRGADLLGYVAALAGSPLAAIALAAAFLRAGRSAARSAPPPRRELRDVLRESLPLGVNGALSLLAQRVELFLIWGAGNFGAVGPGAAGLYAGALRFVEGVIQVPAAISQGALPALTREAGSGGRAVRERTVASLALLAVPAAIGLAQLAPGVLLLLLGEPFVGAAPALRVLALAVVPVFLNVGVSHALLAAGRTRLLPRLTALRLLAGLLAATALVPPLGPLGAALAFLAGESAQLLAGLLAAARAGVELSLPRPVGRAALASLPMAAAVALAPLGTAGRILIGAFVYALTVAVIGPGWRTGPR
ncbi:MAG: lipopolysaccharide biosynthesis protein [Vicinamibacteria bacterium]